MNLFHHPVTVAVAAAHATTPLRVTTSFKPIGHTDQAETVVQTDGETPVSVRAGSEIAGMHIVNEDTVEHDVTVSDGSDVLHTEKLLPGEALAFRADHDDDDNHGWSVITASGDVKVPEIAPARAETEQERRDRIARA